MRKKIERIIDAWSSKGKLSVYIEELASEGHLVNQDLEVLLMNSLISFPDNLKDKPVRLVLLEFVKELYHRDIVKHIIPTEIFSDSDLNEDNELKVSYTAPYLFGANPSNKIYLPSRRALDIETDIENASGGYSVGFDLKNALMSFPATNYINVPIPFHMLPVDEDDMTDEGLDELILIMTNVTSFRYELDLINFLERSSVENIQSNPINVGASWRRELLTHAAMKIRNDTYLQAGKSVLYINLKMAEEMESEINWEYEDPEEGFKVGELEVSGTNPAMKIVASTNIPMNEGYLLYIPISISQLTYKRYWGNTILDILKIDPNRANVPSLLTNSKQKYWDFVPAITKLEIINDEEES